MKKIYISGQITVLSIQDATHNFIKAEERCKSRYSTVINPLKITPLFGIKKWLFYMAADLYQLKKCTHIAMQKNWIHSKGAVIEYFIAKFILKLEVIWL